jgi:hypothetical protein
VLDDRVEHALQCLAAIEAGYRTYAASAIETAQRHLMTINDCNERYAKCLCGMLHVELVASPTNIQNASVDMTGQNQQQQQQVAMMSCSGASQLASLQATSAAGVSATASKGGWSVSSNTQSMNGSNSTAGTCAQAAVLVPGGKTYQLLHDLWQALQDATPKHQISGLHAHQGLEAQAAQCSNASASAGVAAPPTEPSPVSSSPVTSAIPAAAPAKAGTAGTGKVTAKQAEIEAAAAAHQAAVAAAEAEAAAAAAAAAVAAASACPPCPQAFNGTNLCKDLAFPSAVVQQALEQVQVHHQYLWLVTMCSFPF